MMLPTIPVWVFRLIFMIMAPIGAGAVWLTRKYSVSSLHTQNLSAEEIMVRTLSIDVLMAAHLAAFFIVALLPGDKFRAWRWKLIALAVCIWAFDAGNIYQARFSIMDKADSTLASAAERYKTKKKTIQDLQASAKERRAQADREWTNGRWTDAKNGRNKASAESDEAVRLTKELDKMPDGAGSSEVKAWGGEEGARWRAMTEAGLVSFVLIVAAGLAGAMVRELLLLASAGRPVPAQPPAPAPAPAPAVAKPGTPAATPVAPVTPSPAPEVSYSVTHPLLKALGFDLAGAGAATAPVAEAATVTHSAPASAAPATVPATAQVRLTLTPVPDAPAVPVPVPATAPTPAVPEPAPTVLERVQPVVPVQVRQEAPDRMQSVVPAPATVPAAPVPAPAAVPVRVQAAVPAAAPVPAKKRTHKPGKFSPAVSGRYDTGTDGDNAVRYGRVVEAVRLGPKKGGINPSIGAIQKFAGCGQDQAERFRDSMARQGVIEPMLDKDGEVKAGWWQLKIEVAA